MSRSREPVELAGEVRAETDAAWLFYDGTKEVWLPQSLCSWAPHHQARMLGNATGVMTVPEWLAEKEGLI